MHTQVSLAGERNVYPFDHRYEPVLFDGSRADRRIELPAAGNWIVEVVAPGYVPSYSREFYYAEEGWDPVVISVRMKRGGSIRGTVVDERGRPIPGVEISSLDPSYRYPMLWTVEVRTKGSNPIRKEIRVIRGDVRLSF